MGKKIEIPTEEFFSYLQNHTRLETAVYFGVSIGKVDKFRREIGFPRKIFKYRETPSELTQEQAEIITGSLLGDGCLKVVGRHGIKNSNFYETHGMKQYGLLSWKMEKLKPYSCKIINTETFGRKIVNRKVINDYDTRLNGCVLSTISHPLFTELERKWYLRDNNGEYVLSKNGRRIKTIPLDIIINENILSVWFFDDGSNNPKGRQATFNTQSFSREECDLLVEKIKLLGLNCGVVKNRDKCVIQTKVSSYLDLISIVTKRIPCECVKYKTDLSLYIPPDYSTRFTKGENYITRNKLESIIDN